MTARVTVGSLLVALLLTGCSSAGEFKDRSRTWTIVGASPGGDVWLGTPLPDPIVGGKFVAVDAELVGDFQRVELAGVFGYDIEKGGSRIGSQRSLDQNQMQALIPVDGLPIRPGSREYGLLFHLKPRELGNFFTWGIKLTYQRGLGPRQTTFIKSYFGLAVVEDINSDWSEDFRAEGRRIGWISDL